MRREMSSSSRTDENFPWVLSTLELFLIQQRFSWTKKFFWEHRSHCSRFIHLLCVCVCVLTILKMSFVFFCSAPWVKSSTLQWMKICWHIRFGSSRCTLMTCSQTNTSQIAVGFNHLVLLLLQSTNLQQKRFSFTRESHVKYLTCFYPCHNSKGTNETTAEQNADKTCKHTEPPICRSNSSSV